MVLPNSTLDVFCDNCSTNDTFGASWQLTVQEVVLVYVVPIAFALITLCGVLGNTMVIIVYAVNRNLQDSTYALIINLAMADLMFLVFCVPFTAVQYAFGRWPFGGVYCYVNMYLTYVSAYASVWTLVLLAFDRYIVVVVFCVPFTAVQYAFGRWPFGGVYCYVNMYLTYVSAYASVWTLVLLAFDRYIAVVHATTAVQLRTARNSVCGCACVWAFVGLTNTPVLYTSRHLQHPAVSGAYICQDNYLMYSRNDTERRLNAAMVKTFYFGFNFLSFILPLGLTCVLYVRLVQRLWKNTMGPDHRISREALRMKKRVSKLVAIVTLTFAVCWLPQNLKYALLAYRYPEHVDVDLFDLLVQVFAQILAYTNSCINPILFGLVSENFRKGFRALFCRGRLRTPAGKLRRRGGKRRPHTKRSRVPNARSNMPLLLSVNCTKAQRAHSRSGAFTRRRPSLSAVASEGATPVAHEAAAPSPTSPLVDYVSDYCLDAMLFVGNEPGTEGPVITSGLTSYTPEGRSSRIHSMDAARMAALLAEQSQKRLRKATLARLAAAGGQSAVAGAIQHHVEPFPLSEVPLLVVSDGDNMNSKKSPTATTDNNGCTTTVTNTTFVTASCLGVSGDSLDPITSDLEAVDEEEESDEAAVIFV